MNAKMFATLVMCITMSCLTCFAQGDPDLFSLRITHVEKLAEDVGDDRFRIEMEILNWTARESNGLNISLNAEIGNAMAVDGPPILAGADVDPDGRPYAGLPDPPPGNLGDVNPWSVNTPPAQVPTSRITWSGNPSLAFVDVLDPPLSGTTDPRLSFMNFATPGDLSSVDPETIDNGGNVLDGFIFEVDDFDPGEVLAFNWFLSDENGLIGPETHSRFGWGTFCLVRLSTGDPLPEPVFGKGFDQSVRSFHGEVWRNAVEGWELAAASMTAAGPMILEQPLGAVLCEGGNHVFQLTAGGSPPLTYQWFKDGSPIAGATDSQLAVNAAVAGDAGLYQCLVSNSFGMTGSNEVSLVLDTGAGGAVSLWVDNAASGQPGGSVSIPVHISDVTGLNIESISFSMTYDPAVLLFTGYDLVGALTADWSWEVNDTGHILAAGAWHEPLAGTGPLINLLFQIQPGADLSLCSPLILGDVLLNETNFCISTYDGALCPCLSGLGDSADIHIMGTPSGTPGQDIYVPIAVTGLDPLNATSLSFILEYDPTHLSFVETSIPGAIGGDWDWFGSPIASGLVVTGSGLLPLSGDGLLLDLRFHLEPTAPLELCSPMIIKAVDINEQAWCVDQIPASEVCVCLKGDATQDGSITSFDAAQILRFTVGKPTTPPVLSPCNADTTCDGAITALDAAQILKFMVNLISVFCLDPPPVRSQNALSVAFTPATASGNGQLWVPLTIGDATGMDAYAFTATVRYDPNLIQITDVSASPWLDGQDWLIDWNILEPDLVKISAAGAFSLSGEGPLLHLSAQALGVGVTQLEIETFQFNEGYPLAQITHLSHSLSLPGLTITPPISVRGLQPPAFFAVDWCCDSHMVLEWFRADTGQSLGFLNPLVLDPPPLESFPVLGLLTHSQTAESYGTVAQLLVAQNSSWFDLNGDGCNTIHDLHVLLHAWNQDWESDADNSGFLDIRDFLYINLTDSDPCQTPER